MCLILLSLNSHPKFKLIVAANRDEFYARRTAPAAFWEDRPGIVGGRDLEAMGTWMAMSHGGRIAMVTNYRDPVNIKRSAPSRGQLVSDFIDGQQKPAEYLSDLQATANSYNGFNLIVGDQNQLYYYSNYGGAPTRIPDGVHALSNHLLDTPWPKVRRITTVMKDVLADARPDNILNALYDEHIAADNELPSTGVPLQLERSLSAMFIKTPNYGTRCSTVVLVDRNDMVTYVERVYDTTNFTHADRTFEFMIDERV